MLVQACQRGEAQAFHELFEHYREPVFRLAYRFTGNADDAEDLAQDIFVRMFERIGKQIRFRRNGSRAWITVQEQRVLKYLLR